MDIRKIVGIIIIILGIGFLLNRFDIIDFPFSIFEWWPTILIIMGLLKISKNKESMTTGFVLIGLGVIFQAIELDILPGNFWDYFWPLLLIIIGLSLIRGRRKKKHGAFEDKEKLNEFVVFGGSDLRVNSTDFKGGNLGAVFGGLTIDLRDAEIGMGQAELDIFTAFGSTELFVPENWKIVTSGMPILGAMENKTRPYFGDKNDIRPVLNIKYTVLFGSIEIK